MAISSKVQSEIKTWLQTVLKEENFKDIFVNIVEKSEQGNGFVGDIVFITATGNLQDSSIKEYDLVLKCSKRSDMLRASLPIKEYFHNEIFFYKKILPSFTQFQKQKGVEDLFDSVPKYFGAYTEDNLEVVVLQNLKKRGYEMWPKKQPLMRNQIDMIAKEYGRFHALSIAFQLQQPTIFQEFVDTLGNIYIHVAEITNFASTFEALIDEDLELLEDDLDRETVAKWKSFKEKTKFVLTDMSRNLTGLKVILHGDCWSNNFMFLFEGGNQNILSKVAMLDWQFARQGSPILDLSHFLFSCLSREDFENLDDILAVYYKSLSDRLKILGADSDVVYSRKQFLSDWKNYSKHGILLATLQMKICCTDKDEVKDLAQLAENKDDVTNVFSYDLKDKDSFKNRNKPVFEYAVKYDLI